MDIDEKKYYELGDARDIPYLRDLLYGKLRIYQVPPEHRTDMAYINACRWARDGCEKQYAYTEKRLIEALLLSDIMETYRTGDPRFEELYRLYGNYYEWGRLNIFNSAGPIWKD